MTHPDEHWIQAYWKPAMAIQYFVICLFDFMAAPIALAVYAAMRHIDYIAWHPLTLEGGGLYHVSMGAILGIAAFTKGQERLAIINNPTSTETH